ncbi:MAG TPA: hypothetical protein PLB38_03770 [bacterium]|nr:hypothetical protein [bacterium]
MENITLNDLTALLDFGERAEREVNKLFTPPPPTKTTRNTPPRRLLLHSPRLGRKPAKN